MQFRHNARFRITTRNTLRPVNDSQKITSFERNQKLWAQKKSGNPHYEICHYSVSPTGWRRKNM